MPLPQHIFDPPFNIVRCSHVVLTVRDLEASRRFYQDIIGLQVEDADSDALYFRGMEERNHHSLVLKRGAKPVAERLGFKVGSEEDLDRAYAFFKERQLPATFVDAPYQGRTLHAADGGSQARRACCGDCCWGGSTSRPGRASARGTATSRVPSPAAAVQLQDSAAAAAWLSPAAAWAIASTAATIPTARRRSTNILLFF